MKKILIAFDIDGTLRNNTVDQNIAPIANERIRTLLITLASFRNVEILVWSGGGELYARQVAQSLGIHSYVDRYAAKEITEEDRVGVTAHSTIKPDIAIDDIFRCQLGDINLIVSEK